MPSDPVSEESKELGINPCKPHSSSITSVNACNCGRIQDHRKDPFDLKVDIFIVYFYKIISLFFKMKTIIKMDVKCLYFLKFDCYI